MTRKMITFIADDDLGDQMANAAEEVQYLLSHAAEVFAMLHVGMAGGFLKGDDPGVMALSELCERAFRHAAEKEGGHLATIGSTLRHANKEIAA